MHEIARLKRRDLRLPKGLHIHQVLHKEMEPALFKRIDLGGRNPLLAARKTFRKRFVPDRPYPSPHRLAESLTFRSRRASLQGRSQFRVLFRFRVRVFELRGEHIDDTEFSGSLNRLQPHPFHKSGNLRGELHRISFAVLFRVRKVQSLRRDGTGVIEEKVFHIGALIKSAGHIELVVTQKITLLQREENAFKVILRKNAVVHSQHKYVLGTLERRTVGLANDHCIDLLRYLQRLGGSCHDAQKIADFIPGKRILADKEVKPVDHIQRKLSVASARSVHFLHALQTSAAFQKVERRPNQLSAYRFLRFLQIGSDPSRYLQADCLGSGEKLLHFRAQRPHPLRVFSKGLEPVLSLYPVHKNIALENCDLLFRDIAQSRF